MDERAQSRKSQLNTPTRRIFSLALLVVFSALVVLGFAELLARQLYSGPWYENLVTTNVDGRKRAVPHLLRDDKFPFYNLRDKSIDFEAAKPPDERRVLILGDSFTYGSGVDDDSSVFPALLEEDLNRDLSLPGVGHIDILNGGLPGSLTAHWVDLWSNLSKVYKPDVLLIVFFLRDGTRTNSIADFFGKIRKDIVRRNRESFLYRNSYLYRTIRDGFDRQNVGKEYTQTFVDSYFGTTEQTPEWRLAQANLLRLQAMAREQSIAVGLVIFPVLFELNDDYPFRRICDLLEEFAVEHGIPVHSLLPAYMGKDAPALWVSAYDQHPNSQGHRIAADSMLPFVRELLEAQEAGR